VYTYGNVSPPHYVFDQVTHYQLVDLDDPQVKAGIAAQLLSEGRYVATPEIKFECDWIRERQEAAKCATAL
jgi:hypothetical protein